MVLAIVVDAALYYNKVHAGVSVSGQSWGGSRATRPQPSLNAMVDEAQKSGIILSTATRPGPSCPQMWAPRWTWRARYLRPWTSSREGNFFIDLGRRFKLLLQRRRRAAERDGRQRHDGRGCSRGGSGDRRGARQRRPGHRGHQDQGDRGPDRVGGRSGHAGPATRGLAGDSAHHRDGNTHDRGRAGGPGRRQRRGAAAG